jgi:hypothetical protein
MTDGGQQQRGQDDDNQHYHQQFDECECPDSQHKLIIQRP